MVLKRGQGRGGEGRNGEAMRGSEMLVSAQTQQGISRAPGSSRCPGDNFNNSRGAACPSAATAGPAAGMPASPTGAGAQAHTGQLAGQKPRDHKCTMPGPGGQPHTRPAWYQTKSSEPVPRQDPGKVAHPKLPALHLHVALLNNVVETGRHGFPTFSWALGLAEARGGEGCPGGLSFRLLRSPVRDTPGFPRTARLLLTSPGSALF